MTETARKLWLLSPEAGYGGNGRFVSCYRAKVCGNTVLTLRTLHVDRIDRDARPGKANSRPSCAACYDISGVQLRMDIKRLAERMWRCTGCGEWSHSTKRPNLHRIPLIDAAEDAEGRHAVETRVCGQYAEWLALPRKTVP